jgi:hypothetical protein
MKKTRRYSEVNKHDLSVASILDSSGQREILTGGKERVTYLPWFAAAVRDIWILGIGELRDLMPVVQWVAGLTLYSRRWLNVATPRRAKWQRPDLCGLR